MVSYLKSLRQEVLYNFGISCEVVHNNQMHKYFYYVIIIFIVNGMIKSYNFMLLNYDVGEDSWEYLGLQGDPTSPSYRRPVLGVHWKDWCWGWNSNTLATLCEELTHWKRPWCWEGFGAGEWDNRGWDGWVASLTQCTWVWVNSGSRWLIGRPGVLLFMGSQSQTRVSDWTELNWRLIHVGLWQKTTKFCKAIILQ